MHPISQYFGATYLKMKTKNNIKKGVLLLLAITLILSFVSCGNTVSVQKEEISDTVSLPSSVEGPYYVKRVVDGDTFIAVIDGEDVRVRVLCIDTPESVAPEETGKDNTDEGVIASNRAKELLDGANIYLEYDQEKYDQYDRLLAYVYLEDGRRFEDIMISEGLAKVVYYKPNGKYKDALYKLQDKAKEASIGFWGTGFYSK